MSDKIKFALRMDPKTRDIVDEYYKRDGCSSRTEYIEKAILFYTAHIAAEEHAKFATDIAPSAIDADQIERAVDNSIGKSFRPFEKNISAMLYRVAVETASMMHLLASGWNVDEKTIQQLRRMSEEHVRNMDGRIFFEDAMWNVNGE